MARLIILILAGIALFLAYKRYQKLDAQQRKKMALWTMMGVFLLILLILTVTGRLSWLVAAITASLAAMPRLMNTAMKLWPLLRQFQNMRGAKSKMQTAFLLLVIDQKNGQLSGQVLQGQFQGRSLASMSQQECMAFLQECQSDARSVSLMAAYMDSVYPQWRQDYQGNTRQESTQASGAMSKKEAADILGLDENADKKTILKAHKRLIQRLHPDRGGSDYLAAKINEARDVLLS